VAGTGTAVLSGCSSAKVEKLIPYLVQSEDQVPGIPTWYASTCTECPSGCGVHVKTREARAIKLEGNPQHPVNSAALCHRGQAALQGLYNPGRTRGPMLKQAAGWRSLPWDDALGRFAQQLRGGPGRLAVISGAGPGTFSDLLERWTQAQGGRLVRYEAFDRAPERAANTLVFGRDELPVHDFAGARYIVSFGADFLETWGSVVEQQRGFAAAHGFHGQGMAKLVYAGPRLNLTGMNADEWHAIIPGSEAALALGMAQVILSERTSAPPDANGLAATLAAWTPDQAARATGMTPDAVRKLAREFVSASPSLAVAGGVGAQHRGAIEVAAAVNILNYVAGNVGQTVRFGAGLATSDGYGAMEGLIGAMNAGQVAVLLVHDANPAYSLPKSAKFLEAMAKVPFKVSTSLFLDETAAASDLLLPNHHALERWDDLRPRSGVRGLMQPVMTPVFDTMHTGDALLQVSTQAGGALAQFTAGSFEAYLKQQWADLARSRGAPDAERFWREALQHGGVNEAAPAAAPVRLAGGASRVSFTPPAFDGPGDFVLLPSPSSMYHDGRGANRPWLLENPDPVTKITWGSWVEVHPETARHLDVRDGEVVVLTSPHGSIRAPVCIYAGVRPDVIAVPLGLGHTEFGQYARGLGANPLDLLDAGDGNGFLPYVSTRVSIGKTREFHALARTDGNPRQLGRHIAEAMPLDHAVKGYTVMESLQQVGEEAHQVNTEREREAIAGFREGQLEAIKLGAYAQDNPRWGMVIDLARCTGCSSCVTACYSENNIPWVGYDDVVRGREMSWLRIERYFEGGTEPGESFGARVVPMLCQHCENAPCEPVCPVYASYHTADGLNGQVYNRCVGTRYCSHNCPYKVRYFNWFPYAKRAFEEPLHLQLNPEVTVRARGVMEKCTFCVQRIRGAQHQARLEDRPLRDGDVVTACQQACPSGAIVFGNVNDSASRVVQAKENHREYHVLEETNVRPSVTYLAKVQA
jgi:molybdopterin-containing oxidoreductase family iron-sulfur binding subunit